MNTVLDCRRVYYSNVWTVDFQHWKIDRSKQETSTIKVVWFPLKCSDRLEFSKVLLIKSPIVVDSTPHSLQHWKIHCSHVGIVNSVTRGDYFTPTWLFSWPAWREKFAVAGWLFCGHFRKWANSLIFREVIWVFAESLHILDRICFLSIISKNNSKSGYFLA